MPQIKTLIFDVSGVLIELGGMSDFIEWTGKSAQEIGSRWLTSECARDFESGRINFTTFHQRFLDEWEIEITSENLAKAFRSWVSTAYPGAADLVKSVDGSVQVACLANTNEIQWPVVCDTLNIDELFSEQFASHLLGMVKPDEGIFRHVLSELSSTPESTLFIDDSSMNVDAAQAIGMNSVCVVGVNEAKAALEEFGLLNRSFQNELYPNSRS